MSGSWDFGRQVGGLMFRPNYHNQLPDKLSQRADFFVRQKVAITHVKQQQCV
jgi:hypothetical protein